MRPAAASLGAFLIGIVLTVLVIQFLSLDQIDLAGVVKYSSVFGTSAVIALTFGLGAYFAFASLLRRRVSVEFKRLINTVSEPTPRGEEEALQRTKRLNTSVSELIGQASNLVSAFIVTRGAVVLLVSLIANLILIAQLRFLQEQTNIAGAQSKILATQTNLIAQSVISSRIDEINFLRSRLKALQESRLVLTDIIESRVTYWRFKSELEVRRVPQELEHLCGQPPLSNERCQKLRLEDVINGHFGALTPFGETERTFSTNYMNILKREFKKGADQSITKISLYTATTQALRSEGFRAEVDPYSFVIGKIALECRLQSSDRNRLLAISKVISKVENAFSRFDTVRKPAAISLLQIANAMEGATEVSAAVAEMQPFADPLSSAKARDEIEMIDVLLWTTSVFTRFQELLVALDDACGSEFTRAEQRQFQREEGLSKTDT